MNYSVRPSPVSFNSKNMFKIPLASIIIIITLSFTSRSGPLDTKQIKYPMSLRVEKAGIYLPIDLSGNGMIRRLFIDSKCSSTFEKFDSVNIPYIPRAQLDVGGMTVELRGEKWVYLERGMKSDYIWTIKGLFWEEFRLAIETALQTKKPLELQEFIAKHQ